MGFINARRIRLLSLLLAALALTACGFHLRQNANLPAAMQRVHLDAHGGSNFQRQLTLALERAGVAVEDSPGPGIAELAVPTAAFNTACLYRFSRALAACKRATAASSRLSCVSIACTIRRCSGRGARGKG